MRGESTNRDGLQGANRRRALWPGEDLQRGSPPEFALSRPRTDFEQVLKATSRFTASPWIWQYITAYGRHENLKPGMLLDADIMGEKRRLIEWLVEPLYSVAGKVGNAE